MHNNFKKLILVVDDALDNRELLKVIFESQGHKVYCASNGTEALSLLQELFALPDIIFLDAEMPIMDGYQFRTEQKKNERLKDIPVVVMTGDDSHAVNVNMLTPERVLHKPLDIKMVIDIISANAFDSF